MALSPVVHATFSTVQNESVAAPGVQADFSAGVAGTDVDRFPIIFGAGASFTVGTPTVDITTAGILSPVVHATFSTSDLASVTPAGVSGTFSAGDVSFASTGVLSPVAHATFSTTEDAVNAEGVVTGVEGAFTAEELLSFSASLEAVDGAEATGAAGSVGIAASASPALTGASGAWSVGLVQAPASARAGVSGVQAQFTVAVPNWIGTGAEIIPEPALATFSAGEVFVTISSNPAVVGVVGVGRAGVPVGTTVNPFVDRTPDGVEGLFGAGIPTVTVRDIGGSGRRVEWDFAACRVDWEYSRGAVIELEIA